MTFLPIAERELRVAARKHGTGWFRVVAAFIALLIGAGFLTMNLALRTPLNRFGSGLFSTLTWLAVAAALSAGIFFTADALSEEKREGTLGFLFLTDLRGYDVVAGKLFATSLRGAYSVLAIFPVLAVTLLMGGVTGTQFARSSLALMNALFCSLAVGLLVSSVSRNAHRAMGGTFLLLLLICAGGPIADGTLAIAKGSSFKPLLSLGSPAYVFWASSAYGRTAFWSGLGATHALAWVCFALASCLVVRTWHDRSGRRTAGVTRKSYSLRYGNENVRASRRRKLIEPNPVTWLALRERWQSAGLWVLAALILCPFVAITATFPPMVWIVWSQLSSVLIMGLYLWTASQACRFFVDARRSGLLELMVVTPLRGAEVISGQWRALLRMFAAPVVVILLVHFTATVLAQRATFGMMPTGTPAITASLGFGFLIPVFAVLTVAFNMAALMWFGIWMGLTSKNASFAVLKTLLFVQVLPFFAITFASTLISVAVSFTQLFRSGTGSTSMVVAVPLIMGGLSSLLTIGKDVAFIAWSRKRLCENFRGEATRALNAQPALQPLPSPTALPMPPVISTE